MSIEREHQNKILCMLRNRAETKAEILPVKMIDINFMPRNQQISDAYHRITEKFKLGTQYEWIGWYAAVYPGCELCVEKQYPGGNSYMAKVIDSTGVILSTGDIHGYKVESKSEDVMLVIGNVYFPIIDRTEVDAVAQIKEWGYEDVMKNIWFCHNPVHGKPCGICRPCCEKMESAMSFLLPDSAQRRYRLLKKYGRESFVGCCLRAEVKLKRKIIG